MNANGKRALGIQTPSQSGRRVTHRARPLALSHPKRPRPPSWRGTPYKGSGNKLTFSWVTIRLAKHGVISAIARSRWWRATKANEGTDHELLRDRCEYRTGSVQGQCRLCQANHALLQSQCWVALAAVAEVAKAWEEYQYFRSGGTVTAPRTDKFEGVGSPLSSHLSLFSHFFFSHSKQILQGTHQHHSLLCLVTAQNGL